MTVRDDLSPIRTGDLPPWDCCGGTGSHALWCPHHPDNATDVFPVPVTPAERVQGTDVSEDMA